MQECGILINGLSENPVDMLQRPEVGNELCQLPFHRRHFHATRSCADKRATENEARTRRKSPEKLATVSCGSLHQTKSTSFALSDFIPHEGKWERKFPCYHESSLRLRDNVRTYVFPLLFCSFDVCCWENQRLAKAKLDLRQHLHVVWPAGSP